MKVHTVARLCLVLTLCIIPEMILAQTPPIPVGARIRLELTDKSRLEGSLVQQRADSVVVASTRGVHTPVATEYIARIRRSDGKSHGLGAKRGAVIGATIVGGATTLIFGGAALASSSPNNDYGLVPAFIFAGALTGAFYGVIIGGIIGAERWTTVSSAPMRVSFLPTQIGAPGVGVAIRF